MVAKERVAAAAAVAATAVVGGLGTDVTSRWYRRLEKPPWQPPGPAFGIAWSVLHVLLALAGGRALEASGPSARRSYGRAFAGNLVLNAGWTWAFFRAHRPPLALAEALALEASTADLVRRSWRADRRAGAALVPYLLWTTFACALTASITARNRGRRGRARP